MNEGSEIEHNLQSETINNRGTAAVSEGEMAPESIPIEPVERETLPTAADELTGLKTELESERDRRLRLLAEYDNYRRRTQAEFQRIIDAASGRMITGLLPALDDLHRLINQSNDNLDAMKLREAASLILGKLEAAFAAEGLEAIAAIGQQFDPEVHEAVAQSADPSQPDGMVTAQIEPGYRLAGRIIRHARVVVNRLPEGDKNTDG